MSFWEYVFVTLALTNQHLGDCMDVMGGQFSTVCHGKKKSVKCLDCGIC